MSAPFRSPSAGVVAEPEASAPARADPALPPATRSAFGPVLAIAVVVLAYFVFQVVQLRGERDTLAAMSATQDRSMQDSKKVRDALDAVARGTARLANSGNADARLVMDELKRRGVTITPDTANGAPMVPPAR